ncbi:MAG: hypothetical protein ACLP7Q_20280 [Isosphaeraceae bacterium]
MHTIGVVLLAAATAGDGFGYSKPDVGFKKLLRPHAVVSDGAPPPGGPQYTAATMAGGPGAGMGPGGRRFVNTKSQVYFLDPDGMNVGWQSGNGVNGERTYLSTQLVVPARYNFNQGYIYRLKLSNIPGRQGAALYPTIEVAPTTPATDAYLAHNAIPVQFTAEDFDQVIDGGNFVTKVIYLPDPKYQELAVSGVETLVSTRLEPGVDPILEADKRGTILLIARLGAIDLEMPSGPVGGGGVGAPIIGAPVVPGTVIGTPVPGTVIGTPVPGAVIGTPVPGTVIGTPAPMVAPVTEVPPGNLPPGVTPPPPAPANSIPLDIERAPAPAPVAPSPNPAPSTAPAPPAPGNTTPPAAKPNTTPSNPPSAPLEDEPKN